MTLTKSKPHERQSHRVDVVYILGSSRSGTTVLAMVLAADANVLNVGEAAAWLAGAVKGGHCSCGRDALTCTVWKPALDAIGASIGPDVMRQPPGVGSSPRRHSVLQQDMLADADIRQFYSALQRNTGHASIVDASKSARIARRVAATDGLDLAFVHMIRDVRGVYWSRHRGWRRSNDVSRPHSLKGVARVAAYWWRSNIAAELTIRRHSGLARRIKYEHFSTAAHETAAAIGSEFNVPMRTASTPSIGADLESRHWHHSIAGNPVSRRDKLGAVVLDDEWRTKMPRWVRVILYVACYPLCRRYGYQM